MENFERELEPGDLFAGYRIESIAGRGGMGVVYRARQTRPQRLVAIKVISIEWTHNEEFRARFEREISLAAEIEHPNVIPVYQVGEEDGRLFIAMRFVDGRDLSELCKRRGPLAPREAGRLITQIAQALDAAHAAGVVHRDVKPQNVLVTGKDHEEHLYLTDFGLARRLTERLGLTSTGDFVGTIGYVSPEQIGGQHVDARTDIYALGCVLYELLVGSPPFASQEVLPRMLAHHQGEIPQAPSELAPGVPAAMDDVVTRAMAGSRDERFLSAGDLARAAVAAATGRPNPVPESSVATGNAAFRVPESAQATHDGTRLPSRRTLMTRVRQHAWMAAFALIGLCALAIVLAASGIPSKRGSTYVVSADWGDRPSTAPVRYCSGKDLSAADLRKGLKKGVHQRGVDDYVARFPGATATFVANSAVANNQREYYLRVIERGAEDCDVIFLDVIYMAEFVDKGLLYDMTPYLDAHDRRADFDDQMIKTVAYDEKLWGVPKQLDAGVLFYRNDRVRTPSSWQDVYRQARRQGAAGRGGLRLQRETNEGLTVVFLELAYAAGDGRPIISPDGKTADIDEPAALDALTFLRNAVRDRVIPPTEPGNEGSLDVYERGRASFLRGWPFVAARIQDDAERTGSERATRRKTARETRIASLPPWRTGGRSFGVLGGHNLVIPRSAANPSGALHFIDYLTGDEQVRKDERLAAQYPVLKSVAADKSTLTNKALVNAIGETEVIPRPFIPQYAAVSNVIASGVQRALAGPAKRASIRRTLIQMDKDVQDILR